MSKVEIINYWQALPWNDIKRKTNLYLPKLVFILLLVLIAQTFAELTWNLFTPDEKLVTQNIKRPASVTKTAQPQSALKNVASYHLFGDAEKKVVVQQKVIDAPETRLRIDLKGVFASSDTKQALAIISTSKGKDKTYHLGDKITAGAILHAVYADRVILKRNGQLETLRLPKSKLDNKAIYKAPQAQRSTSKVRRTQPADTRAAQTQSLKEIRETLLKDPSKIWQQVRINPVMKNGEVQGYTLAHNDQKLMKSLNLKNTDIITSINGQSLSDPATLYGLMSNLSTQQSLELSIERNGQPQTIQLTF